MNKIRLPFLTLFLLLVLAVQAQAWVPYSFTISNPVIAVDDSIESTDLWYKWTYKVEVVSPETGDSLSAHQALSHMTLGLKNCWLEVEDETIRNLVWDSIGFAGNNPDGSGELRSYDVEFEDFSNTTDPDGIKWNVDDDFDDLNEIGEFDYFWFSVPTNEIVMTRGLLKYGSNYKYVDVETPACPGCHTVPEPISALLFGAGALSLLGLKRRK